MKVATEMEKHNKCPPHWWVIDSEGIGRCKYCPAVKDFRKLHEKELHKLTEKQQLGAVKSGKVRSHRMGRPPKYA
ncbi:unnamed protein product [marine sediment metagenome]|uniref:Uncharacterized protein n=1 Tax=marine sediment metagenome TaxID=412755 RepID=X1T8L1_9ZZZZ